jgi:hypothetical protein
LPPQFGRDKNIVQAEKKSPTSGNYQKGIRKSDNKERVERVLLLWNCDAAKRCYHYFFLAGIRIESELRLVVLFALSRQQLYPDRNLLLQPLFFSS